LVEVAILYATVLGWPVFPLHSPKDGKCDCRNDRCDSPAKHPRVMRGLKAATTAPEEIREWWSMWPTANIAVATGERSNLAVLDIDDRHGGGETLTSLIAEHGIDVDTLACHTGSGGMHLYFRLPTDTQLRNSAGALGPGLDVRAVGGYVIGPPSVHISGHQYRWGANGPGEATILPFPQELLRLLQRRPSITAGPTAEAAPIPEGRRDDVLASFAGRLRNMGEGPAEIEEHLAIFNRRCTPPKSVEELRRIAYSIARYPINGAAHRRPVLEGYL
jgi:hypothetical protein